MSASRMQTVQEGCSGTQSCPVLRDPMESSTPGFPVLHHLWSLLKSMSIELVMLSNHLILCHCLLFLPAIFPSIRVFSSESAVCFRWPKYWSFSFSISPSSEYSGFSRKAGHTMCRHRNTRWEGSLLGVCSHIRRPPELGILPGSTRNHGPGEE